MAESHDPFDDLLRAAMQRRPEADAPDDLAARAMEIAHTRAAMTEPNRLWRYRLMVRLASLAAVVLIGLFVCIGVHRLSDRGDLTLTPGNAWTDSSTATATDSSTGTASSSSSDSSTWNWIIMAGVVGLTGLGAAAVIRQSSPFAGAAGLGRFA
jgi:hypothetical protein